MPRYKFAWSNLPGPLLKQLRLGLGVQGPDAVTALGRAYGGRPTEEFVADRWEDLLEKWLAHDPEALTAVVRGLWRPNSREGYKTPATTRE